MICNNHRKSKCFGCQSKNDDDEFLDMKIRSSLGRPEVRAMLPEVLGSKCLVQWLFSRAEAWLHAGCFGKELVTD